MQKLVMLTLAVALVACAGRGRLTDPVRVSELRWRTCPPSQNTEVTNGSEESVRVIVTEEPSGSPNPAPPISLGVVQSGETEMFNTIGPTMRTIEIAPVERPREINGNIRRPIGYERIQIRCVAR